jgi:molecular chaperone Hsp33
MINKLLFKNCNASSKHLTIGSPWQKIIEGRNYQTSTKEVLSGLCVLGAMLASDLKHKGKITLQIRNIKNLETIMVDVNEKLEMRGFAREASDNFSTDGDLVITLYNAKTDTSFQSITKFDLENINQSIKDYFTNSSQNSSNFFITTSGEKVVAILLQKLPLSGNIIDKWEEIDILANTITSDELFSLGVENIFARLFAEYDIEIFTGREVKYKCDKNIQKFEKIISDIGELEASSILAEQGKIEIFNEICNEKIVFNQQDLDRIFKSKMG